ncbi:MAG: hypothetical protein HZA61_15715 [Candidatus Eisenbacteria bacterium]|uniref:Uncharacterized protein n=1 Tax=Eiseniibacteriota bacterium TaxID=2212470 RepID=A0A933W9S6_UNCEI|nr:hypothetical protein [Candidatus Eisenbacteria bacterium]
MILFRRAAVILSVVAMCATPALARRVGTPGSTEDNVSRSQPHSPATEVQSPRATPTHPGNANPDDPPICVTPPSRLASTGRTESLRPSTPEPTRQPSAPEPSQERRDKSKTVIAPMPRVARQAPQHRPRVNTRPLPAAPGMGTLIRMGMTVGREISFLEESVPTRPLRPHGGRAPPARVSVSAPLALAAPAAPLHPAKTFPPAFAPHRSRNDDLAAIAAAAPCTGSASPCPIGSGAALASTLGGSPS